MAKRQIILDTETTGINPLDGHRIVEIGCVEMYNRRLTGNNFHMYLNPDRFMENCWAISLNRGLSATNSLVMP